jgi:hypothetical protein
VRYIGLFWEMEMAKTNLASMSVDALLKLREDIGTLLSRKADQLKDQLSRLGHEIGSRKGIRRSSLKGRKIAELSGTASASNKSRFMAKCVCLWLRRPTEF